MTSRMGRRRDPSLKPVKLRIAAAAAHDQITRRPRYSMRGPEYIAALNKAASMLAQLAEIYHCGPDNELIAIPKDELIDGQFDDGGNLYRAGSGRTYKGLLIHRIDVLDGITVLQQACKALDEATPQHHHETE